MALKSKKRIVTSDEMFKLNEKVSGLEKKFESLSESTFRFVIDSSEQFINTEASTISARFFCAQIPWYLVIKSKSENEKTILSLYLHCDCTSSKFSIQTNYELRLISQLPNIENRRRFLNYTFDKKIGHGCLNLIDVDDLTDPTRGFIKDGIIITEVYLKIDKITRE